MVVGNKCDIKEREVSESEGLALAKKWGCSYIETSAKHDFQVRKLFEELLYLEKRHSMTLEVGQGKGKKSQVTRPQKPVQQSEPQLHKQPESQLHKCMLM